MPRIAVYISARSLAARSEEAAASSFKASILAFASRVSSSAFLTFSSWIAHQDKSSESLTLLNRMNLTSKRKLSHFHKDGGWPYQVCNCCRRLFLRSPQGGPKRPYFTFDGHKFPRLRNIWGNMAEDRPNNQRQRLMRRRETARMWRTSQTPSCPRFHILNAETDLRIIIELLPIVLSQLPRLPLLPQILVSKPVVLRRASVFPLR